MILLNFDQLLANPSGFLLLIILSVIALVAGFTVHEFSHALTAHGEGDATARRMGRLTLNPIKHVDWLGFALILFVGFGWAKPVQVDPYNLRHGRLGMAWVALAGPLSNFVLAFLFGLILRFDALTVGRHLPVYGDVAGLFGLIVFLLVFFNLMLGIFNLIPIPPLDGSKVLGGLLPDSLYYPYLQFERFGWLVLLGLVGVSLALSYTTDINLLAMILLPPVEFMLELATGGQVPF